MRLSSALILTLAGLGTVQAADIYCVNQGRDCSDRPSPGAIVVHVEGTPEATDQSPREPAPQAAAATPAIDAGATARLNQDANRKAVQQDVAKARTDQCKQAQEKYQKSIEARRIFRTGKDGEREYLSDSEIDQMRLNARLELAQACDSKVN